MTATVIMNLLGLTPGSRSNYRLIALCVFFFAATAVTAAPQKAPLELESYYNKLNELIALASQENRQVDRGEVLETFKAGFGAWMQSDVLEQTSDEELELVYKALAETVIHFPIPVLVRQAETVVDEMVLRNHESLDNRISGRPADPVQFVYESFLAARMIDDAVDFADRHQPHRRHPMLEDLKVSDEGMAAVLVHHHDSAGAETSSLEVEPLAWSNGAQIIVVSHPGCGFSRAALEFFEKNAELATPLINHITWLVPQSRTFPFDPILDWNRFARNTELTLVYREDALPESVGTTATPVFFFFKNGERIRVIEGWPGDDQFEVIVDAADDIGIMR